jgi:hypothetical protein
VWRLLTSNGTWAVKEPFEPKSEAEFREEAEIQETARDAGIPAPEVLRSADGNVSLVVGDVRICVFGWVDVLERDPNLDPVAVGRIVASIHRVPFPEIRGEDPCYREPITSDRWQELRDDLKAAGRRSRTNSRPTAPNWLCSERSSNRRPCSRPAIGIFGRTTSARPPMVGSASWTGRTSGSPTPSQELCLVLFEFGAGEAERARDIYRAYVETGGPGRVTGRRTFSMLIAQLGHIGEAGCEQWLTAEASSPEREHAATWVGEFLEQPLSIDAIDRILDAIRSR